MDLWKNKSKNDKNHRKERENEMFIETRCILKEKKNKID